MAAQNPTFSEFSKSLKISLNDWKSNSENRLSIAFGNNDFLLHKASETFKATFTKDEDTHYGSSEGDSLSIDSFQSMWQSQGLFEPTSAYVLRRAEKSKQLQKFVSKIPRTESIKNNLLICLKGTKVPIKLKKEFDRLGASFIPCFNPTSKDIPGFIGAICKKYKLNVTGKGQLFLQQCLGENLFQIENEIIKLKMVFSDAKQESQEICGNDIAPYLGVLREDHAFKLTNLLLENDLGGAQILASSLITKGESSIAIVGILSRHIRNAIRIGEATRSGGSADLARKLRLPNFVIRSYNQYVKGLNLKQMSSALAMCQTADLKLKTSKCSYDDLIVSEIILALS